MSDIIDKEIAAIAKRVVKSELCRGFNRLLSWQTERVRVVRGTVLSKVKVEILPVGRKRLRYCRKYAPDLTVADRRPIPNLVVEARKYSALAVDTLVELTKDNYAASTRYSAATALLDRGYGRPAQSLDLHLSADAITKRLSDMTDAELAALEARMIAAAPIVLEATADVSDDACELSDGDAEQDDGDGCVDEAGG